MTNHVTWDQSKVLIAYAWMTMVMLPGKNSNPTWCMDALAQENKMLIHENIKYSSTQVINSYRFMMA